MHRFQCRCRITYEKTLRNKFTEIISISVQCYHKFIQNLAWVASPLYEPTSKGKEWEWNHIHENSYYSYKKILDSDYDMKPISFVIWNESLTPTMTANQMARLANIQHGDKDDCSHLADKPDFNFDQQEVKEYHNTFCKISSISRQIIINIIETSFNLPRKTC
ncbi:hypothetical protein RF11_05879 [Thelohanellus kitauei]|uniref:Uncharacterized protein n=1 Tax=Thelohanellus kitauei TaxID=669202 RepID=A0A0C2JN21_THEKT|nr:hypothetical protein RF11_05879 [Thelohanellus kitauei]